MHIISSFPYLLFQAFYFTLGSDPEPTRFLFVRLLFAVESGLWLNNHRRFSKIHTWLGFFHNCRGLLSEIGMNHSEHVPAPGVQGATVGRAHTRRQLGMLVDSRALRLLVPTYTTRSYGTRRRAMSSNLRYLLVLDFEATCGESGFPRGQMEIIEFPTIVYDLREKKEVGRFHEYVRPVIQPQLTEFCTQLTGITQVSSISSLARIVWVHSSAITKRKRWTTPRPSHPFGIVSKHF